MAEPKDTRNESVAGFDQAIRLDRCSASRVRVDRADAELSA